MLAYEPGVAVAYDVGLTALSLTLAIAIAGAGLAIATTTGRAAAPIGGATVAVGIAAMHYTGMAALEVSGRIGWSAGLVMPRSSSAWCSPSRRCRCRPRAHGAHGALRRLPAHACDACAHHFTAMGAVELMPDPTRVIGALAFSESTLALTIAGVAFAVLGVSIIGAIMDRRLPRRIRSSTPR